MSERLKELVSKTSVRFTTDRGFESHPFRQRNNMKRPPIIVIMGHIDHGKTTLLSKIRDTRMQEHLFETAKFPSANITAALPKELMKSLKKGASLSESVTFTLDLHGKKVELTGNVAINVSKKAIQVNTVAPIMLDAAAFDLVPGIEMLKKLAGLDAIATAVPVTLHLVLEK